MSVLVKGMKMPKHCFECTFYKAMEVDHCFRDWCVLERAIEPKAYVPDDCPLVEVPPHGDLIDKEKLLKYAGDCYDSENHLLYAVGTGTILLMPTIIEAEKGEQK